MPQRLRALTITEEAGFIPRTHTESQDNIQKKYSQISSIIRFLKNTQKRIVSERMPHRFQGNKNNSKQHV